jgi:hypothetical protein
MLTECSAELFEFAPVKDRAVVAGYPPVRTHRLPWRTPFQSDCLNL